MKLKTTLDKTREKLNEVIFGTSTPSGRLFDLVLIYAIVLSVLAVALDSVETLNQQYGRLFFFAEWFFTLAFTLEYMTRIWIAPKPWQYIRSFYGIIDLLSILPSYIAFFIPHANYLMVVRIMRVLRIFRILRMMRFLSEANILMRSLMASRRKILIFFSFILALTTVYGSIMYIIEGPENGFTSIPKSIYWAIVTITTVGYGDIAPSTVLGQMLASLVMITGYSVIAVPTGIITAELATEMQRKKGEETCKNCERAGHDSDAKHCKFCGAELFH